MYFHIFIHLKIYIFLHFAAKFISHLKAKLKVGFWLIVSQLSL